MYRGVTFPDVQSRRRTSKIWPWRRCRSLWGRDFGDTRQPRPSRWHAAATPLSTPTLKHGPLPGGLRPKAFKSGLKDDRKLLLVPCSHHVHFKHFKKRRFSNLRADVFRFVAEQRRGQLERRVSQKSQPTRREMSEGNNPLPRKPLKKPQKNLFHGWKLRRGTSRKNSQGETRNQTNERKTKSETQGLARLHSVASLPGD